MNLQCVTFVVRRNTFKKVREHSLRNATQEQNHPENIPVVIITNFIPNKPTTTESS